jgi:hypothetical protein
MVKSLELAIAEVANLPAADQEQIGRRLLSHVEKLRKLRAEVDKGIRSLDQGEGARAGLLTSKNFSERRTNGMAERRRATIWSPDARADLSEIWDYLRGCCRSAHC